VLSCSLLRSDSSGRAKPRAQLSFPAFTDFVETLQSSNTKVFTLCKSRLHLGGGVEKSAAQVSTVGQRRWLHPRLGTPAWDRSERQHPPSRAGSPRRPQPSPGLEANGSAHQLSCCARACAELRASKGATARLWLWRWVPAWGRDARVLSPGGDTGKVRRASQAWWLW